MPLGKAVDWEKDKQEGETKISGVILKYPYYPSYCKVALPSVLKEPNPTSNTMCETAVRPGECKLLL